MRFQIATSSDALVTVDPNWQCSKTNIRVTSCLIFLNRRTLILSRIVRMIKVNRSRKQYVNCSGN